MKNIKHSITSLQMVNSNGTLIDLLPYFVNLQFFEDIYQPFLTGRLVIEDRKYIFESLPFIGKETLTMEFSIQNDDDAVSTRLTNFIVLRYSFTELSGQSETKAKLYMLDFIDKEGLDALNEYSISFSQKLVSEMVATISKNLIGKSIDTKFLENTKDTFNIAFPYMTPVEMIQHLSQRYAVNSKAQYGYLFYTDFNQKLHFTSINTLMSGNVRYPLKVGIRGNNDENPNVLVDKDFEKIVDLDDNIREGLFGSKIFLFDLKTKQIVETNYKFSNFRSDNTFMGRRTFYNKEFDKYNITSIHTKEKNFDTQNVMLFSSMENYNLLVKQEGNWGKTIGMVADLTFDAYSNEDSEHKEENLSGKWLSTRQVHTFDRDGYFIMTTFVKNAFNEQPNMKKADAV